ncbi:MAG: hypothetical protein R6X02_01930 [Enhygromyxa sp.]
MVSVLSLACPACGTDPRETAEAGVGGSREGCGEPGSHSYPLSDHSCACEVGYEWCSKALDELDCCPSDEAGETGEPAEGPELPCDSTRVEQLICLLDPAVPEDPKASAIWACNGERWVEVSGYSSFACMAAGFSFAYGCVAGEPEPSFLCGYGPGSTCDPARFPSVCVDEDIIDACVWGLRTVDRCSRLCAALEAFGPGASSGACVQPDPDTPATCECVL